MSKSSQGWPLADGTSEGKSQVGDVGDLGCQVQSLSVNVSAKPNSKELSKRAPWEDHSFFFFFSEENDVVLDRRQLSMRDDESV